MSEKEDQNKTVTLDVFIDVSCPWCHGALETNRVLLDELMTDPQLPKLRIKRRFMRLHPMPKGHPVPLEKYFASWGDASPEAIKKARDQMQEFTDSVGVRVDFEKYTTLYDPFTAHRLLCAIRDDQARRDYPHDTPALDTITRAIFNANFVHGVDITKPAALKAALQQAGLITPERIWSAIEDGGYSDVARTDHKRALEVKLDGVPRIVVEGRQILPTWIDYDEAKKQLRRAIIANS